MRLSENQKGELGIAGIINTVGVINAGGNSKLTEKHIYSLRYKEDRDARTRANYIYLLLKDLRRLVEYNNREKLATPLPDGINPDGFRKMVEVIFNSTNIDLTIYKKKDRDKSKQTKTQEANKGGRSQSRQKKPTETITVLAGGRPYAEHLKKVKTEIGVENIDIKITGLRKSTKGNLMMTADGNADAVRYLKNKMEEKMGADSVRYNPTVKRKIINIRDLDKDVDKEEILNALRQKMHAKQAETIIVKSLRPAYGETQVATLGAGEETEEAILTLDRVKIGLVSCRVRARIELNKCYKCWTLDHNARDCKGPDRTEDYYNCGGRGYKAKECKKVSFCPICNREGHRANTRGCPRFRNVVHKAYLSEKNGNAKNQGGKRRLEEPNAGEGTPAWN